MMIVTLARIEALRKNISELDPSLSVWQIRQSQEVKDAGLEELAYALTAFDSNCSVNDAKGFFDDLEKWIKEHRA